MTTIQTNTIYTKERKHIDVLGKLELSNTSTPLCFNAYSIHKKKYILIPVSNIVYIEPSTKMINQLDHLKYYTISSDFN